MLKTLKSFTTEFQKCTIIIFLKKNERSSFLKHGKKTTKKNAEIIVTYSFYLNGKYDTQASSVFFFLSYVK